MLLREWVEAFRYHAPSHLHGAVSAAIRSSKFWPTIAEISAEITKLRREAVEAIQHLEAGKRESKPEEPFAKAGRTEAEEIIHRAAQLLKWKQDYKPKVEFVDELNPPLVAKAASQEMAVSDDLLNSRAAKIARGEAR